MKCHGHQLYCLTPVRARPRCARTAAICLLSEVRHEASGSGDVCGGGTTMSRALQLLGLVRSLAAVLLLSPTLAWGADGVLVQQIGALFGEVAEAVAAQVRVVPF